jgi:WD40-like Beta Propeller Repeat
MTPHDELDLQLRGWMRTRAAQSAPPRPDLVDGAMARAATVRQRPRALVRTGEGAAMSPSVPFSTVRWVLLLGALLAMLVAGVVLVGSRPTGLAGPVLVWTEQGGFHLVEPDGTVRAGRPPAYVGDPLFRSDDACPRGIPGTTFVLVQERFIGLEVMDVIGDAGVVATVKLNGYAGTEYLAPSGPRLVQFELDPAGENGVAAAVVDLADPPATPRFRIEAPGVVAASVDATGRWLALAIAGDGRVMLELVDVRTGERRPAGMVPGSVPADAYPRDVLSVAPGGNHVVLRLDRASAPGDVVIVDTRTAVPTGLGLVDGVAMADLAWSPDGRWLAVPQRDDVRVLAADGTAASRIDVPRARDLAWSPDGSRLAFGRGGGGLVTVARDGSRQTSRPILLGGFLWAPDGTLVAAHTSDDGHDVVLDRYRADEVAPFAPLGSFPIAGNEDTSNGFAVPRACLSWAGTGGDQ